MPFQDTTCNTFLFKSEASDVLQAAIQWYLTEQFLCHLAKASYYLSNLKYLLSLVRLLSELPKTWLVPKARPHSHSMILIPALLRPLLVRDLPFPERSSGHSIAEQQWPHSVRNVAFRWSVHLCVVLDPDRRISYLRHRICQSCETRGSACVRVREYLRLGYLLGVDFGAGMTGDESCCCASSMACGMVSWRWKVG